MSELAYLSAVEATRCFSEKTLSPVELMRAVIERCEAVNPAVNAFTFTFFERALAAAKAAEDRYFNGEALGDLDGVPLVVKDSTNVQGEISTKGSRLFADHRPQKTDPSLRRLLDAGAIMIARSTRPEFGEAANCYTPLWGVTRNPWNLQYGPGGSSSGSAVAVASGMSTIADGSDIGGSIRIPAACCGVVGYKPPFGRNPLGAEATFDPYLHYGPITRRVADAARMQNIISGAHVDDIASLREKVVLAEKPELDLHGWTIAYSVDLGFYQVDLDVRNNMLATLDILRDCGCEVEEVELGWTQEVFLAWKTINALRGRAATYVGDLPSWRDKLADYTLDWLEAGDDVTREQVVAAYEIHVDMYRRLGPILDDCHAFICPTNAIPSIEAERSPLDFDFTINDEPARAVVAEAWFMTYPFNMLSQLPVMSVPSGFAASGVPTGIQIVGRSYDDQRVFAIAGALEQAIRWDQWTVPL